MILLRLVTATLASVSLLVQSCHANSVSRNPITSVTSIENVVLQSPTKAIHAHSHFDVYFTILDGNKKVRLALEPNDDVISPDSLVTHLDADGNVRATKRVDRSKHRVYRGTAYLKSPSDDEWTSTGWARIVLRRDGANPMFEGTFRVHGDHHHVNTVASYRRTKHADDPEPSPPNDAAGASGDYMVVWRDSDIMQHYQPFDELRKRQEFGMSTCGSDDLNFNANYKRDDDTIFRAASSPSLFGRQTINTGGSDGVGYNLVDYIGSTAGCPKTRMVALLGIAADCNYRQEFSSDEEAQENIVQQVNAASAVYESSFNISLGLQNLVIVSDDCPASSPDATPWNVACGGSTTITDRLSLFSEWRGRTEDTNAFWTLLTTCQTESAVGLAWLGQICQQGSRPNQGNNNEIISSTNVVVRTSTEWQVLAHEIGHTFGAVHDCTEGLCRRGDDDAQRCCPLTANTCDADSQFIMNPSTGRGIDSFSPCSIGNMCASVSRSADQCLVNNRGVTSFTGSQCGNGIVETGEDCDCGGDVGCGENSCCDPETCKFTTGSVCDPSNEDCCTDTCQFASAGTVCRDSTGLCDPEEVCAGDTSLCPKDKHLDDGTDCGDDGSGLTCASGQCTSRDSQCAALVGGGNSSQVTSCEYRVPCVVACRWPRLPEGQCNIMNSFFLDGTPCRGGGMCDHGECVGSNEVAHFVNEHKNIIIPVASVVGALVALALLWCLFGAVRRRVAAKKRRQLVKAQGVTENNPNNNWGAYGGSYAPRGDGLGLMGATQQQQQQHQRPAPPPPHHAQAAPPPYPPTYQPYQQARHNHGMGPPQPPVPRRPSTRYA